MYMVRHARSNIVAFFKEQEKFPEERDIGYGIWKISAELKSTKIVERVLNERNDILDYI